MERILQRIDNNLKIILSILLEKKIKEGNLSDQQQVSFLQERGLGIAEIAMVLGKTSNAVRILLTRLRKKGQKIPKGGNQCQKKFKKIRRYLRD
ncbi:MAG: hypothetical protein WC312_00980 [Candidatus Omnitrophota bacterium]|jgi:hypothetical protein